MNAASSKRAMHATRRRRAGLLVAACAVMLVVLAGRLSSGGGADEAIADDRPTGLRSQTRADGEPAGPAREPVRVTWPIELVRDPFRPISAPGAIAPARDDLVRQEALRTIRLQVVAEAEQSWVMVNGRVAREKDVIDGFEIIQIKARAVTVRKEGVDVTIEF